MLCWPLKAALDAGVEEVFASQGPEPSGIAGKQIDDAVKGALQDVGIKLRPRGGEIATLQLLSNGNILWWQKILKLKFGKWS